MIICPETDPYIFIYFIRDKPISSNVFFIQVKSIEIRFLEFNYSIISLSGHCHIPALSFHDIKLVPHKAVLYVHYSFAILLHSFFPQAHN